MDKCEVDYGSCREIDCPLTPSYRMVLRLLCLCFSSKRKTVGDINYIAESTIEGEGQWLEGERRGLQKSRLTIAQCPHYCIVTMATSRTFETASSNSRIELIPDCSMRRHKLRETLHFAMQRLAIGLLA